MNTFLDIVENQINESKTPITKDVDIFRDLMNSIVGEKNPAIKALIGTVPSLHRSNMSLEELEKILIKILRSVVLKMYQSDTGRFSIKNMLRDSIKYPGLLETITDNLTYGVISASSTLVLGSLLKYVSRDFLFFYIRDTIVELNYRTFVTEIQTIYEVPSLNDRKGKALSNIKNKLSEFMELLYIKHADPKLIMDKINSINTLKVTLSENELSDVPNFSFVYPTLKVIKDILSGDANTVTSTLNAFSTKYVKTFTKESLEELFHEFGINSFGSMFNLKINTLIDDRNSANGLRNPIDGLTISENKILKKISNFQPLSEIEENLLTKSKELSNIYNFIKKFPSVDHVMVYDNDKVTITNSITNTSSILYFRSVNAVNDANNPFIIFNKNAKMMERLFKEEPEKFCGYQTILTSKERRNARLNKRFKLPTTIEEKLSHRNKLKGKYLKELRHTLTKTDIDLINKLSAGKFSKLTYVKPTMYNNPVINDKRKALLTLCEMEGILKIVTVNTKVHSNNNK